MAKLRNRDVTIERVADEIDHSTFVVVYPDRETEYAKMHELSFTKDEYNTFVKPQEPQVSFVEEEQPAPETKSKK